MSKHEWAAHQAKMQAFLTAAEKSAQESQAEIRAARERSKTGRQRCG